jgi:hypothetical protein
MTPVWFDLWRHLIRDCRLDPLFPVGDTELNSRQSCGVRIMITREFRTNRAQFPVTELEKYRGSWVAFSLDGQRIVASAETLAGLEDRLAADGYDPQRTVFEMIFAPDEDHFLGSEEIG